MPRRLMIWPVMLVTLAGCKVNPAPPSVDDAKATWLNINQRSGLAGDLQLIDLKKTDGQFAEVNGTKVYPSSTRPRKSTSPKWGAGIPGT